MKIKTIQFFPIDGEKNKNLRKLKNLFEKNDFSDTNLVLLPELWSTGVDFDKFEDLSENIPGKTTKMLSSLAKENKIYLLGGSIVEKGKNGIYNTSTFYGPQGELKEKYRKIHLFSYSDEDKYLSSGNLIKTYRTEFGKIGFSICYDLRFPEQFRKMMKKKLDIILCPSAWPKERDEHWEILNKARAIENQSFLISCNRRGKYEKKNFIGNSMIVDPWGNFRKNEERNQIFSAKLDLNKIQEVRSEFPILNDYREIEEVIN